MALRPFVDAAGAAGAAGDVAVAFVIDFGPGTTPVVGCVDVPPSDNGYDALAAFASQEGIDQPTYNSSGLLCSINSVPSSGCGQAVAGGYIYWSYFTGGKGGWTYASSGAFGTVTPGEVQGWRFQNPGKGSPSDPAPRSPARYDSICGSGTTPTTAPSGGSSGVKVRQSRVRRVTVTPAVAPTVAPVNNRSTSGSTTTVPLSPTTTTYPPVTATSLPNISVPADPEKGLDSSKHSSGDAGGGPGPDPLIIGGLLIAALGVAAYTRWRRRPRTP
jgi:MYXO-CTERM domain-containing protein